MNEKTLCAQIAALRRGAGMTQEQLAQRLNVSYQAVSKWENNQSCPDVSLLPQLADIFGVSLDRLFGREAQATPTTSPQPEASPLPWDDDDNFYAVLYRGHRLLNDAKRYHDTHLDIRLRYEGEAKNLTSAFDVVCSDVCGDVQAGGNVRCEDVSGNISAQGDVSCEDVGGDVSTSGDVDCCDIAGNLRAGGDVDCCDVTGSIRAGGDVNCCDVSGNISAAGDVDSEHDDDHGIGFSARIHLDDRHRAEVFDDDEDFEVLAEERAERAGMSRDKKQKKKAAKFDLQLSASELADGLREAARDLKNIFQGNK